jgi:hypothetical protein
MEVSILRFGRHSTPFDAVRLTRARIVAETYDGALRICLSSTDRPQRSGAERLSGSRRMDLVIRSTTREHATSWDVMSGDYRTNGLGLND